MENHYLVTDFKMFTILNSRIELFIIIFEISQYSYYCTVYKRIKNLTNFLFSKMFFSTNILTTLHL